MKAHIQATNTFAEIIGIVGTPTDSAHDLPLYLCPAEAGFLSPDDDFVGQRLNLHKHLIKNEAATFFARAHGESMINAGIMDSDLLVVDCSVPAERKRIVIAALEGEFTVKRFVQRKKRIFLASACVDCYNFYAFCEKLFGPDHGDKPIVALSKSLTGETYA